MKLSHDQFRAELADALATGDEWRWRTAALCARAQDDDVKDWLPVACVMARRRPRTIREWVQLYRWTSDGLAEFRTRLGWSFLVLAMRYAERISETDIRDLLSAFADEAGATLEDFRFELNALAKDEREFDAAKWLARRVSDLREHADLMPDRALAERVLLAARILAGDDETQA